MKVASLRGGEKFDADSRDCVLRHWRKAPRAVSRHRNVILLVGGGWDRIDACRIGSLFVLGDERRRGHLGDHESGVKPRLGREERRQPGERWIDQKRDPPLGERADFADRERNHVGGEGDRLGVKVAARQRFVGIGEDERIVGNGIRFRNQRRRGLAQKIEAGPHHLRLAAQAIGVLHSFVAREVRSANGASGEQGAQRGGDLDLASMAAKRMYSGVERRVRSACAVGRHCASDKRRAEQRLGLEQADQRISGRELRAVEQSEPLLGLKRDRLEADLGEASGGGRNAIPVAAPPPTPIIAAAIWASGARSPDAPTDPCAGTTGVRPRASIASMRPSVRGWTPEAPWARLPSFSAIMSRVAAPRRVHRRRPRATGRCCAEAEPRSARSDAHGRRVCRSPC